MRGPDNRAFARKFLQATLLYGSKHGVLATNPDPFLRLRSLADMQRRNSAGKVLKRHLAKAGLF